MDYGMGFYGGYGLNGMPQAAYGVEEDVLQQHAKRQRTDAGSAGAGYEKEGQDPERTVRGRKDCFFEAPTFSPGLRLMRRPRCVETCT